MAIERLPPQNIEAEQSVLGSLLIDRDAIVKVAPFLRAEDFYRETHAHIYQAIFSLYERGEPADLVTVCDELERLGLLEEVGGASYIISLANIPPTAAHIEHYSRIVERLATLRRLITAAGEIAALAYEASEDIDEAIDRAEAIVLAVSQRRITQTLTPIREILEEYYQRIGVLAQQRGEILGVPTGFPDLDKILGGLQPSDLVVVAGRPGMGKSALVLSIARNIAVRFKGCVALFSLEMSAQQVAHRLLAIETGVDSQRLRLANLSEEEFQRLVRAIGMLSEAEIYVDDTPAINPVELRTKARRLHSERGLALIVVDYLQLMQAGRRTENRVQEISLISRELKALARELSVPVLACSQLSRAVEGRDDKHPILSDLRESGSIEQDADVVIFIYRDEVYKEDTDRPNIADVTVAKQRHGPTGRMYLRFMKEQAQFANLETFREEEELEF